MLLTATKSLAQEPPLSLFDGETLAGWESRPGEEDWWRVQDGAIAGGSLERAVPHNVFLATEKSFQNFELTLEIRVLGDVGFINSGIQIRSRRVPTNSEMSGYQVDAGDGWWGKLYDESRRNRVLAVASDLDAVEAAVQSKGWNSYRILAEDLRIRSWINGIPALDYTEPDEHLPREGKIAIQVHGGGHALVEVRQIAIRPLPDTPGAMTWRKFDKAQSVSEQGSSPIRTPAEEHAGFTVADGFEIELVACEPSMNKVVDLAFDDAGRMWAITAVEYPLDGNESAGVFEKYKSGGRDRVLVFDTPCKPGPHVPRVFAEGLTIPLALLPEVWPGHESVLIGNGPEILRLTDNDGDGQADQREVVLSGFGIQDSHLLPHRFVRAPGDWIYVAQGAFNSSQVRTSSGEIVAFDKCKIGRFQRDGSRFEVVGTGLNNIWGFVIDRKGDKWIQEANDLGYALVPFEHGASYPGIGNLRARPHSPWRPSLTSLRMGGTGLSGLALSEARSGFPVPWDETFFVANPILSAIQGLVANRQSDCPETITLARVPDLLTSADKNFRPVAIHFGPDDCLYIVDWYNPIISHNEVPRDHPLRDKTHSRIWRIRHTSQSPNPLPDLTREPDATLVDWLRDDSTFWARAAWHQIADRQATSTIPALIQLALDTEAPTDARVLALWCLRDLDALAHANELDSLRSSPKAPLRRETALLVAERLPQEQEPVETLGWAMQERDPRVRRAAIEALQSQRPLTPEHVGVLLGLVRSPEGASKLLAADIEFERSLVRIALEGEGAATLAYLIGHPELPDHARSLAALCTDSQEGALILANALEKAQRNPTAEEYGFLVKHAADPALLKALSNWWTHPRSGAPDLRLALQHADRWDFTEAIPALAAGLRALLDPDSPHAMPPDASAQLFLDLASRLRISELEPDIIQWMDSSDSPRSACINTLRELGCKDASLFFELAHRAVPASDQRQSAALALATIPGDEAFNLTDELMPYLETATQRAVVDAIVSRKSGAHKGIKLLASGDWPIESVSDAALRRFEDWLGESPELTALHRRAGQSQVDVMVFGGSGGDYVHTQAAIRGPFTLEAWVKLEAPITNADGLLCSPGKFDFNFAGGRARLWCGQGYGDVIIARTRLQPGLWTHVALTRDSQSRLCLYINGTLDQTSSSATPDAFDALDVCRTTPPSGTAGLVTGLRLWTAALSPEQVSNQRRLSLASNSQPTLAHAWPAEGGDYQGQAHQSVTHNPPPIQSLEQSQAMADEFERFQALASQPGRLESGRDLFVEHCLGCHQVGGSGGQIGPALDGAGAKGIDGLLHAILTPNAGVESGYRTLVIETREGQILEGFLARQDGTTLLLRRKDRPDLTIHREEVLSMRFDRSSLMPEGLLDLIEPDQIGDLFTYLLGL